MIDFIKAEILDMNIATLMNNKDLDFTSRINRKTGEVDENNTHATYNGLTFTVRNRRRIFIQGSLAKFYFGNNHRDIKYSEYLSLIQLLEESFGINPDFVILQNIEFGASVDIGEIKPTPFLKTEVLDYKGTTRKLEDHNKTGYTVSFPLNNYTVKLYDKGRQCHLATNVLRYEIRVKKMIHVKNGGIKTLNDLTDVNKWIFAKNMLIKALRETTICGLNDEVSLTENENNLYLRGQSHIFWEKANSDASEFENGIEDNEYKRLLNNSRKQKAEFKKLVERKGFDKNKKMLITKMEEALNNLIKG